MNHARKESERDPICQPLCVIRLANAEERFERIVSGNDETCNVDEKLATDVEEDEEEVQGPKAQNHVHLGDRRLLLKILERGIFGKLHSRISARTANLRIANNGRSCSEVNKTARRPMMLEDEYRPLCRAGTFDAELFLGTTWL